MSIEILLLLGTILAAVVLFSLERVPVDVTALGILLFLVLTGLLPSREAFAGFGSDVVVMMLGLLILMEALSRTGVTGFAGRALQRWGEGNTERLLLVVMVAAVTLGAFMSNTAATAFFLPIVIGLARRAKVSAAKLLMPLVSTSTNVIVSGLMVEYGLPRMGMFELAPVGVPIAIVGMVYMLVLGRRLVPDRIPAEQIEDFSVDLYLTEVLIRPRSFALTSLEEGDVLLVEGGRENILQVKEVVGIDIRADVELSDANLQADDVGLIEAIVMPGSPLIGRTLNGLRFRDRYGLQVLAINRHGEKLTRKMSQIRLRVGDVLVLQGNRGKIEGLARQNIFRVLASVGEERPNRTRAPLALAIFLGVLAAATFDLLPLSVAMLLGALLVFVTRCITPEEAYSQISWRAIILIASMLSLGAAMQTTGAAEFLAGQIIKTIGHSQPIWLLTGFFALTVVLTQPMSNQAAAVVVLPIAIQMARQLGLNPRSFAMMIALAASCSFLTPLEPSCLLVYGPGRYRFKDFPKVGLLLTLLIYAIAIILVPLYWPVEMLP